MPFLWHPLVVHFPIALWLTSFLFDLLYVARKERFYADASRWLIGLGLLGAVAAVATGFADFRPLVAQGVGQAFVDQHVLHSRLAYAAGAVYAGIFLLRRRGRAMARGPYLLTALAGAALIGVTAYLGGEMRRVM